MRILITGGTGFIGQNLVQQLVTQGFHVSLLLREAYAFDQQLPEKIRALREHITLSFGDLRNFRLTSRCIRETKPDIVIHLAAAGSLDPFLSVDNAVRHNINGTLNLSRACFEKERGVKKLIVARTPGEIVAMNTYAASKAAAWKFCTMYARTQGWPIVGAMLFQVYGDGQQETALIPSAIRSALGQTDFPMTAGTQQRDWTHVDDICRGLIEIAKAEIALGETVDLGTGTLTSVADVVRSVYAISESEGEPLIGRLPSRRGEEQIQVADVAKTSELLGGWKSAVSLQNGLSELIKTQRT